MFELKRISVNMKKTVTDLISLETKWYSERDPKVIINKFETNWLNVNAYIVNVIFIYKKTTVKKYIFTAVKIQSLQFQSNVCDFSFKNH